jgi:D-alanine-D-alanine ligase
MQQKTVLLLFGGESSEYEVSISSARNVYAAIDNRKFNVVLGFISRLGKWHTVSSFDEINDDNLPQLLPMLGCESFRNSLNDRIIKPDVILPILHGKNGEDGSVQALAVLLHIPIVGCDMTSSAICMDKIATKQIASSNNVPVVDYRVHHLHEPIPDYNVLSDSLGDILFVKPASAGSSVGACKVHNSKELEVAINLAHKHDKTVLIERSVVARELEIAVLGNVPNHQVSAAGEIKPEGDFYSYESKYDEASKSEVIVPADLDSKISKQIHDYAYNLFIILGCRGLARIDFFLTNDNVLYFNEVNTMPGFTDISMYPRLWQSQGISYPDLIEKMITLALQPVTM